jgi:hypothetical protein
MNLQITKPDEYGYVGGDKATFRRRRGKGTPSGPPYATDQAEIDPPF